MGKVTSTSILEPKFLKILLGSSKDFQLERQVLNATILASAVVATGILFETFIFGISLNAVYLALAATAIFWTCYGLGRKKAESNWLIWVFLGINLGFILLDWLFIGGYSGISLRWVVVITGLLPIITKRKHYLYGFTLIAIVYIAFFVTTVLFHDKIPIHTFTFKRVIDVLLETAILSFGIASMTYLTMRSYRHQKEKTQQINQELSTLNKELESRTLKLQKAIDEIKTLQGILPICASCKKIRDDKGYWNQIEIYIRDHSEVNFSHSICPECSRKLYSDLDE